MVKEGGEDADWHPIELPGGLNESIRCGCGCLDPGKRRGLEDSPFGGGQSRKNTFTSRAKYCTYSISLSEYLYG
jgi:hypothetical protein